MTENCFGEREFFIFPHCAIAECGNYGNLLSRILDKTFVKPTFLLFNKGAIKELISRNIFTISDEMSKFQFVEYVEKKY